MKTRLKGILSGILISVGLISQTAYASSEQKIIKTTSNSKDTEAGVDKFLKDGKFTVILLGIDGPQDEGQRSDTVMIAQFNKDAREIRIISMPRDSYVDIPGEGFDKLTHAFAYGGAELTMETLNNNLDVGIDGFMTLNFKTFPQFIDALGGVEVDLSLEEAEIVKVSPGKTLLTGAQALTFGRIRKIDSDYMRTKRHRRLMRGIIDKILSLDASKLPELSVSLYKTLNSDVEAEKLFTLGKYAYDNKFTVKDILIPDEENSWGNTIEGAWVLEFDIPKAKAQMKEFFGK